MLVGDDDCNRQRAQRMAALKFVVLTLGALFRTACHGVSTQWHGGRIQLACEERGTLLLLNKRIWTELREYGIVLVLSCFVVDPVRGFLPLARCYKVNFDAMGGVE